MRSDDLYFIRTECGHFKIGRARDPKLRLKELQHATFAPLTLFASLRGRGREEREWHAAFADDRVRGEWFAGSEQLLAAINAAQRGSMWQHHKPAPKLATGHIGQIARLHRMRAGLTQNTLAKAAKLRVATLSSIEVTGKGDIRSLSKIAAVLGLRLTLEPLPD